MRARDICLPPIHADHLALFQEERNLHRGTGFQFGRLGTPLRGVTPHARIGFGDRELHEVRQLDADHPPIMKQSLALHVLLQVSELIFSDHVRRKRNHLKGLLIHEVEQLAVGIGVLNGPPLQPNLVHLFARAEGFVGHRSGEDIFQLGAHERAALAGLDVLKIGDGVKDPIHLKGHPVAEIGGRGHKLSCAVSPKNDGSSHAGAQSAPAAQADNSRTRTPQPRRGSVGENRVATELFPRPHVGKMNFDKRACGREQCIP